MVLDDLMDEGSNDKRVLDLFPKHSHHQKVTVIHLCQDMFPVGKYAKSISRNAHYIVAFKNPRDQLGVRNVLLQSFPTTWKDSLETFHHATARPCGYLVLDLHSASSNQQRLLSHVLKDEGWTRTYQKRRDQTKDSSKRLPSRRLQGLPTPLFWICWGRRLPVEGCGDCLPRCFGFVGKKSWAIIFIACVWTTRPCERYIIWFETDEEHSLTVLSIVTTKRIFVNWCGR